MRLDTVRQVLASNVNKLTMTEQDLGHRQSFRISDFLKASQAVQKIQETGMFKALCSELLDVEVFALAVDDSMVISLETYNKLVPKLNSLRGQVQIVLAALNDYLAPIPSESIRVKLPDIKDLEAAGKLLLELDKLLNQLVVNDYLGGQVTLERFVAGSSWVDIYLGSSAAITFLAGLISLFFGIKQKQTQESAREQLLTGLEMEVSARNAVLAAIKSEVENFQKNRMRQFLEENKIPLDDHEFARRTEHSLRMLGGLLERGLEVHPSLTAPQTEQKLFPDPKRIREAIKELPEHTKEDVNQANH